MYVNGYEQITSELLQTVASNEKSSILTFAPLVKLGEQQQEWENFVYDYFENVAMFPKDTGINTDFGKGIWSVEFVNGTIKRKHETSGIVDGMDKNWPFLFPAMQLTGGPLSVLLFSLRYGIERATAIDSTIECSYRREKRSGSSVGEDDTTIEEENCGSATEMLNIVGLETRGPASVFYEPIFPRHVNDNDYNNNNNQTNVTSNTKFVGIIAIPLLLDETLDNVFSDQIRGVDAVYTTSHNGAKSFTFTIVDGIAVPK